MRFEWCTALIPCIQSELNRQQLSKILQRELFPGIRSHLRLPMSPSQRQKLFHISFSKAFWGNKMDLKNDFQEMASTLAPGAFTRLAPSLNLLGSSSWFRNPHARWVLGKMTFSLDYWWYHLVGTYPKSPVESKALNTYAKEVKGVTWSWKKLHRCWPLPI